MLECGTVQIFVRSASTPLVPSEQVALRIVNRQAVLATAAGTELEELSLPTGNQSKGQSLFQALLKAAKQQGVQATGVLQRFSQDCGSFSVDLTVSLPARIWRNSNIWKKSPAAAVIFTALQPLAREQPGEDGQERGEESRSSTPAQDASGPHAELSDGRGAEYTLGACFSELPNHVADLPLPEPQVAEPSRDGYDLADLPLALIQNIVARLDYKDVARLGHTCSFFRALAEDATPGLLLSLFPHQRAAVRWMLAREEACGPISDPCWRALQTGNGLPFWVCSATGDFRSEEPRQIFDRKGGLFCDEPGLGKTITGLALVLKTKGTLPPPPQGFHSQLMTSSAGHHIGYYLLPPASAASRKGPEGVVFNKLLLPSDSQESIANQEDTAAAQHRTQVSMRTVSRELPRRRSSLEGRRSLQDRDAAGKPGRAAAGGSVSAGVPSQRSGSVHAAVASHGVLAGGIATSTTCDELPGCEQALQAATPQLTGQLSAAARESSASEQTAVRSAGMAADGSTTGPKPQAAGQPAAAENGVRTAKPHLSSRQPSTPHGSSLAGAEPAAAAGQLQAGTSSEEFAPATAGKRRVGFVDQQSAGQPPLSGCEGAPAAPASAFAALPGSRSVRFADPQVPAARPGGGDRLTQPWDSSVTEAGMHSEDSTVSAIGPAAKKQRLSEAAVQKPSAKTPKDRKRAAAAEPPEGQLFVQCEICSKWRLLPDDTQVDESSAWVCPMHPDPAKADCKLKEERVTRAQFTSSDGFVALGQPGGQPSNLHFFRQLLAGYPELVEERHSALWWLAKQKPDAIAQGIQVPRYHLEETPVSFEAVFSEIGLRPSKEPAAKKARLSGSPAQQRRRASGGGSRPKTAAWEQPGSLSELRLDTLALRQVLQTGPAELRQKVFLSPATLLVVPAPLVQHWVYQVQQHTRFHELRLLVISSDRERSNRMPPPHSLAWDHDLVITTLPQLSAAWADHSRRTRSPFMQVHWLRVIVDEGHMLGNSLQMTNKLAMACALRADRRWLMTGTPTPGGPSSDIAHLQPLLSFLHNEPYGTESTTWQEAVQKPFEAKQPEGRRRLVDLLSRVMIRAAKADLMTIPPLYIKVTMLDFAPEHAASYNELVDVVHRNLLTADWYDEDNTESLFCVRNARWAREMLDNVKKSCCVAGNCELLAKEADVQETLQLISERHQLPAVNEVGPPWVDRSHPLARLEDAFHSSCHCDKCGGYTRMPFVTPCAHLLCSPCTSEDRLACPLPGCRQPYVMQSVDDPVRKETNPNPKWDVPGELIEWQISYTQKGAVGLDGGAWSENYQITKSTKCVHLLKRLYDIGAAVNPTLPETYTQKVRMHVDGGGAEGGRTKAIIFSQFWIHTNLVANFLERHGVEFALLKAGLHPTDKVDALDRFQNDDRCGVLLMDQTGAVGLDLSFASWVFLLEPIEDVSVQQQVVSRAHRMGARLPIHVEVLAMKGTAEEQLVRLTAQERAGKAQPSAPAAGGPSSPEKAQAEAKERSRRNHMLRAMRRISEALLPAFQDLPLAQ